MYKTLLIASHYFHIFVYFSELETNLFLRNEDQGMNKIKFKYESADLENLVNHLWLFIKIIQQQSYFFNYIIPSEVE